MTRDEITINLRALSSNSLTRLENIIDEDLNDVPDEDNEEALETLREFITTNE